MKIQRTKKRLVLKHIHHLDASRLKAVKKTKQKNNNTRRSFPSFLWDPVPVSDCCDCMEDVCLGLNGRKMCQKRAGL